MSTKHLAIRLGLSIGILLLASYGLCAELRGSSQVRGGRHLELRRDVLDRLVTNSTIASTSSLHGILSPDQWLELTNFIEQARQSGTDISPGRWSVKTGVYQRVTWSLLLVPTNQTAELLWQKQFPIPPEGLDDEYGRLDVIDFTSTDNWGVVFYWRQQPRREFFVDAVPLSNAAKGRMKLEMRLPMPRRDVPDFRNEFGIAQGRFISFAEDSLYLCTVPYTGKAVNQVTLWKVNLEKGAIEFLGHYDRFLTPVWKSVTDMFPPPPPSTNTVPSSITPPVRPPKPAKPILEPPPPPTKPK